MIRHVICILAFAALTGCAAPQKALHVSLTNYDAMDDWKQDNHAAALAAFRRSCMALAALPPDKMLGEGSLRAPAADWQAACGHMPHANAAARIYFETHFTPFAAKGDGLFTGYYEPLLRGSYKRSKHFQTPVYRLPPDVKEGAPYFTRSEIDNGALEARKLELLWVDDPVMLFFAEVQGSALVQIARHKKLRIGFAGKNNRTYVAIGKILKERGELTDVNFFNLRQWLYDHPDRAREVMEQNASYVFFRKLPPTDGPIGAEGVALTRERSLAVDKHFIPLGLPLYLQTTLPDGDRFNQLMIAQDVGGAIKGPVRGDVFFGHGAAAEQKAGMMQSRGNYILLLPNEIAEKQ